MKKLLMMCLLLASLGISAQKSYVMISVQTEFLANGTFATYYLSGDVPSSMDKKYEGYSYIGTLLNTLSSFGFEVESMCNQSNGSTSQSAAYILLSKTSSTPENITRMASATDEEIKEVARYNLQGIPVNENTKGIQIIVYSNYTTKTVVVE